MLALAFAVYVGSILADPPPDVIKSVTIYDARCAKVVEEQPEEAHDPAAILSLPAEAAPIFHAIRDDDVDRIRSIGLTRDRIPRVGERSSGRALSGLNPLAYAAQIGSDVSTDVLLELGADPNESCHRLVFPLGIAGAEGVTPLIIACSRWSANPCVVRRLLLAGADPNLLSGNGVAPLTAAAGSGYSDVVELLLAAGARIEVDGSGASPVHTAARASLHRGAMEALLEAGADPNRAHRDSLSTPLHDAIKFNPLAVDPTPIRVMLEHGADATVPAEFGKTPLHIAAEYLDNAGAESIIPWLLEHGAPLNAVDEDGRTALALALSERHAEHNPSPVAAFALLRHGADVRIADEDGMTPLHWAVELGDADLVRAIVKAGGSHLAENKRGETPLGIVKEHDDPMKRLELRRALAGGGG